MRPTSRRISFQAHVPSGFCHGSIAAYVAAIGGHLRLVADFDQATTTFVDYTLPAWERS